MLRLWAGGRHALVTWLCGEHRLQPARAWPGKLGPFWVSQPGPPAFLIRVSSFEGVVNCFYERKQLCFSAPFHCTDACHLHLEESWSRRARERAWTGCLSWGSSAPGGPPSLEPVGPRQLGGQVPVYSWCPQRGTHTTHACTHPCSSASRTARAHPCVRTCPRAHLQAHACTHRSRWQRSRGWRMWPQPGARTAGGGKGQGGPRPCVGPLPVPRCCSPGPALLVAGCAAEQHSSCGVPCSPGSHVRAPQPGPYARVPGAPAARTAVPLSCRGPVSGPRLWRLSFVSVLTGAMPGAGREGGHVARVTVLCDTCPGPSNALWLQNALLPERTLSGPRVWVGAVGRLCDAQRVDVAS